MTSPARQSRRYFFKVFAVLALAVVYSSGASSAQDVRIDAKDCKRLCAVTWWMAAAATGC
jgi:hypothetical protein